MMNLSVCDGAPKSNSAERLPATFTSAVSPKLPTVQPETSSSHHLSTASDAVCE